MNKPVKKPIQYEDFAKVDIRVGRVVKVEDFEGALKPAYKVWVDFGEVLGVKQSSAQIKKNQTKEDLLEKQVICVVNFEPKQVGPFRSEVLILGAEDGTNDASNWVIVSPFKKVKEGGIIG